MNICIYGIPTVVIHNTFYFYIYVSYIPLCRFLLYVNVYKSRNYNTSWPSQEAKYLSVIITWPPFFQYNKRRLRKKNVRDMLVYAPE